MKKYIFMVAVCILYAQVSAQNNGHTLSGEVLSTDRTPLPGATIFLENLHRGMVTDATGKFFLKSIPKGKYEAVVRFTGYKTQYITISVPSAKPISILLQEDDLVLNNVIVKGQSLTSAAIPESALTEKEIEITRGESLGESLAQLTGVSTLKTGSGVAKPVVHGLSGNRIVILNNDVKLEGQQWGTEHAPEIDPFIAKKIKVVKGAAAVKYGSEALGGVVIVEPPDLPTGAGLNSEINLIGMSNGRSFTGDVQLEGGFSTINGLGWRIQGSSKNAGDTHTPDYNLTNSGVKELNYSIGLGLKKPAYGIELYHSHFDTEVGILKITGLTGSLEDLRKVLESERPPIIEDFSYDIGNPRQQATHDLFKINGFFLTEFGRFNIQYGLQLNKRKEFDIRIGSLSDIPSMNLEITTHSLDLEWVHNPFGLLDGSIGLNGAYQDNINIPGTQRSNFIPNFNNYSTGIYLIEGIEKSFWELEAGVRYDTKFSDIRGWNLNESFYYDNFHFTNFTATLNTIYHIGKQDRIIVNVGSSWRPPNMAELYSFGKHQSAAGLEYGLLWFWDREAPPPANIYIRKFDQVAIENEQGFKWLNTYEHHGKKLNVDFSAYLHRINNYIFIRPEGVTKRPEGALPYFWYRQTDALFLGIDADTRYPLFSFLNWNVKLNYLWAKDVRNNDYLPFIPANQVETGFEFQQNQWGKIRDVYARFSAAYTARQKRAPRVISPEVITEAGEQDKNLFAEDPSNFDFLAAPLAYTLVNLDAGITVPTGKSNALQFRLGIRNLFNVSYRNYTNRLRYYADDEGRNFIVSLKFNISTFKN